MIWQCSTISGIAGVKDARYSQLEQIDKTQVKIMSKKPTYEEIEQRIKELENEAVKRKQAEKALRESEDNIRTVLESTADGILAVDAQGKVRYSNRIFAEMWHIPRELLETGKDDQLLNHVLNQLTDPEVFVSKVERLYGSSEEDFDVLYFKDGRIFERFSRPLKRNGMVDGRVWSFRDVTERKRFEEALRESEERYRTLLETTSEGYTLLNAERIIIEVNEAFCKMLGYSQDEILGKTPFDLVDDENREIFVEQTSKISDTEHRSYEITL